MHRLHLTIRFASMHNNWVKWERRRASPADLQWTSLDVHATNHSEFDETPTTLSWSISTSNHTHHRTFSTPASLTWIRSGSCECSHNSINASGTKIGISYGLDSTIAHSPNTPKQPSVNVLQSSLFYNRSTHLRVAWRCSRPSSLSCRPPSWSSWSCSSCESVSRNNGWRASCMTESGCWITRSSCVIWMYPHW